MRKLRGALLGLITLGLLGLAAPAQAETIYAVTAANGLFTFDNTSPSTAPPATPITGLNAGENVVGIDVRPATGQLYAVTSENRIRIINPATAVAGAGIAPYDPFTPALTGTATGADFNPVPDALRVVTNGSQNLRFPIGAGTAGVTDTPLNPAPKVATGGAYTNNGVGTTGPAPGSGTTLFDIDSLGNTLERQGALPGNANGGDPGNPNSGVLNTVGSLGADVSDNNGFDISPSSGGGNTTAYLGTTTGGVTNLHTVNLTTGAASAPVGTIGNGATQVVGLAVAIPKQARFEVSTLGVDETAGTATINVRRSGDQSASDSINVQTFNGSAKAGTDYSAVNQTVTFIAGDNSETINVPITDDIDKARESRAFTVQLNTPSGGFAVGSPSELVVTIRDVDGLGPNTSKRIDGLTESNKLISFAAATPGTLISSKQITGLQAGEDLLGIDLRSTNARLYGLGSSGRLYELNRGTGAATQIGNPLPGGTLSGTSFGFDFNPTVDRIRVVSNTGLDLRLNPNAPGGNILAATDPALAYFTGDRAFGAATSVVGAAYTDNQISAAPVVNGTTLYELDAARQRLIVQNPPNAGKLVQVGTGGLGVNIDSRTAFDIAPDNGAAYASAASGGASTLYDVDLGAGSLTSAGTIGGGEVLRGLAVTDEALPTVTPVTPVTPATPTTPVVPIVPPVVPALPSACTTAQPRGVSSRGISKGFVIRVNCPQGGRISVFAQVPRRTARSLGITKSRARGNLSIGRGTRTLTAGGATNVRVRFTSRVVRALRRSRKGTRSSVLVRQSAEGRTVQSRAKVSIARGRR